MLGNVSDVNDWFSAEDRVTMGKLGVLREFTHKVFCPEVIRK